MAKSSYEKGLKQMVKMFGPEANDYVKTLTLIFPEFAKYNVEFPFGALYSRDKVLDLRTREIATLAALVVLGHSQPQLAIHTKAALHCGVTKEEILEIILQMTAYGGFPAATNALLTVNEVFSELKKEKKLKKAKKDNKVKLEK